MMQDLWQSEFVRTLIEGSVLLPGAVAVLFGTVTLRVARARTRWSGVLWAVGLLVAFLGGYAAAYRDFTFPPHTVLSWLPWVVVVGGALVALAHQSGRKHAAHGARTFASAGSTFIILWPILRQERLSTAFVSWLSVTVLWSLLWVGLTPSRDDQKAAGTALFVTAAALALVAPLSGSIELARLSGSLAVALAVGLFFSIFTTQTRWDPPTADVPILILGALLVDLQFYAGAPLALMAWLIAALAVACGTIVLVRRRSITQPWRFVAPGLSALLPIALAVWTALRIYRQSSSGY